MIAKLDPESAPNLSPLRLPYMNDAARAAFQGFQRTEYTGDKSLAALAIARGCIPHPCDWFTTGNVRLPDFKQIDDLYQPWIDALAAEGVRYAGLPRYHSGVTVTKDNWHRHGAPRDSFKVMLTRDRRAALELLDALDTLKWESSRCAVISCLGNHPMDTPWLERFVREGTPKVQDAATKVLEKMEGESTAEQVAVKVATYFELREGSLTHAEHYDADKVRRLLKKTNLDCVAREFSLTAAEFASRLHSEKNDLWVFARLIGETGDRETRTRFAQKMLEQDNPTAPSLYRDVLPALWELAAQKSFSADVSSTVFDFFGYGTLTFVRILENYDLGLIQRLSAEPPKRAHVTNEFLLFLGLAADKNAAQSVLDKAVNSGLDVTDPRLTVLHFNLAL